MLAIRTSEAETRLASLTTGSSDAMLSLRNKKLALILYLFLDCARNLRLASPFVGDN